MKKTHKIIIEKKAAKFLASQPPEQQKRLARAISQLPEGNVIPLKGYKSLYRLRVGDYRIIFTIKENELLILVLSIGNRGDVYKKL
ncbi:mRNA interferase RelE/StbE [Caldanaerobius fijiensis DSM 17918]|uniref:mRNA interferase RelE/StbE n=1 Tax=Caldanaerobius fijiensis DSM 17918 TaxID=1121256 RepID=A0A1M5ECT0_9THEO|nr:type II toxin-antitoxin system RelE/ParE family toxin [Caldanaerobius fijiensis]SHF76970.1 mRNA interferase RelE/StbE [Caldanaerobius fijiensis DSM 17918]